MLRGFFVLLLSQLIFLQVWAGLHLEPYVGYESGTLNQTDTSNMDLSGGTTMTDMGVRLGYSLPLGLWVAADLMSGTGGQVKGKSSDPVASGKSSKMDMGLSVGYEFPIKLRFYGGYILSSAYTFTDDTSAENKFTGGTAYKLGVGYRFIPWLAFNLEYYSQAPVKYSNSAGTFDVSEVYRTFNETGFRFVTSFPIL